MNITVEQVVQATPEVRDLIGELNDVLGAAYEADQRHGLSVEQLFESHEDIPWPSGTGCARSNGASQPCLPTGAWDQRSDDGSRMNREVHVRF